MKAKFDLEKVKDLINSENIWFSAPTRSINQVLKVYNFTRVEAIKFILDGISNLNTRNFSRSILMWDTVCDEYGLTFKGINWYIKFTVEDEVLEQISFHPLEKDMRMANGEILRKYEHENG